jgi:hypothetical protein
MGRCEYVLARDRVNNTFEIRQTNEPCGNGVPACTRSLTVIFPNITIELRRGMTLVNGGEVMLPANYGGKKTLNFKCYISLKQVDSCMFAKLHCNTHAKLHYTSCYTTLCYTINIHVHYATTQHNTTTQHKTTRHHNTTQHNKIEQRKSNQTEHFTTRNVMYDMT